MKSTLLMLVVGFFCLTTKATGVYPDSVLTYSWNPVSSNWDSTAMHITHFNTLGKATDYTYRAYQGGGMFKTMGRHKYNYNGLNQLDIDSSFGYDSTGWTPIYKVNYTYNAAGMKIVSKSVVIGNGGISSWDSIDIVLDGSNRGIDYTWYWYGSFQLQPIARIIVNSYGTDGPDSYYYLQLNGSVWDTVEYVTGAKFKEGFSNDPSGIFATDFVSNMKVGGVWTPAYKRESTYLGPLPQLVYNFTWNGTQWDTAFMELYTYDGTGNRLTQTKYEYTSPGVYNMVDATVDSLLYNSTGYVEDIYRRVYDNGAWSNNFRAHNYYSIIAGINAKSKTLGLVYPNPAADLITVEAPVGSVLNITDMQGRSLFSGSITQKAQQLDLSPFSKGVLLLSIQHPDGTMQVEKILHQD